MSSGHLEKKGKCFQYESWGYLSHDDFQQDGGERINNGFISWPTLFMCLFSLESNWRWQEIFSANMQIRLMIFQFHAVNPLYTAKQISHFYI